MRIFINVFLANLKELLRDKTALFWFLAFPIFFVFLFGIVFSGSSELVFNLGIIIEEPSEMTDKIVEAMRAIDSFKVSVDRGEGSEEMKALQKGERHIVIKIPAIDYQKMASGQGVEIPVYYDASKQQTSQVLMSVVEKMFGEAEHNITGIPEIFKIKQEAIQADKLTDFDYILPGILAMALMQLGLFGSLQFLSLREQKIVRSLGVTPLARSTLLISEIALRLLMALVQTFLIITIARIVFGVTIISNIFAVFAVVIIGSLTFISLGYMLISFVKSNEAGQGIIQIVQFPMMFLSGIFFPPDFMPSYIQAIVRVIPLTYLGDALRQVMIGVYSGRSMLTNIIVLSGWLIVTLIITIKFWRWD